MKELCVYECSSSLMSAVLKSSKKTLKRVELHDVELEQTEEVQELLESLISCEILEELHLRNIYIYTQEFRFVT